MRIATSEREPLGDETLKREQEKAEEYVNAPERITLSSLKVVMKSTHDTHLITYNDGKWSCSCDFFLLHETCSHVMATGSIFHG